jgi:hypothetical protein
MKLLISFLFLYQLEPLADGVKGSTDDVAARVPGGWERVWLGAMLSVLLQIIDVACCTLWSCGVYILCYIFSCSLVSLL